MHADTTDSIDFLTICPYLSLLLVSPQHDTKCPHRVNGCKFLVWFVGFYGISTFVGYLTPNPFLCK